MEQLARSNARVKTAFLGFPVGLERAAAPNTHVPTTGGNGQLDRILETG